MHELFSYKRNTLTIFIIQLYIISDRHIIESFINYLFHALCECSENVFVLKYILHVQFG